MEGLTSVSVTTAVANSSSLEAHSSQQQQQQQQQPHGHRLLSWESNPVIQQVPYGNNIHPQ